MNRTTRRGAAALCAAAALPAVAALPAEAAPKRQAVDIRFAAMAGDSAVSCDAPIEGLGTTGQAARLMDLRFYVANARLVRRDGSSVRVKLKGNRRYQLTRGRAALTLIDLENGRGACADGTRGTNASVRGTVPRGRYVGLRWTLGVPFALNHTDAPASPAPLNSTAMAWSWQVGRKFTKIEVTDPGGATGTWTEPSFYVHLGSAGCEGNPATGDTVRCAAANRPTVRLRRFDPRRQRVAVDLRALLAGNDITVNRAGAPGCMAGPTDPECGPVFRALGLGGIGQSVFRPVAR